MRKEEVIGECQTIGKQDELDLGNLFCLNPDGVPCFAFQDDATQWKRRVTRQILNLTGRDMTLFCSSASGSELKFELPASGKAFVRRLKVWRRSVDGLARVSNIDDLAVPIYKARPQEDLLGTSEIVEGLPAVPDRRYYYLVTVDVDYTHNRRNATKWDILIPGKARINSSTGQIIGFENLTLFQFTVDGCRNV